MIAATEKSVHRFFFELVVVVVAVVVALVVASIRSGSLSRVRKRERFVARKALLVNMVSIVVDRVGMLSKSLSAKQRRLRKRSLRTGVPLDKRFKRLFSFLWLFALRPKDEEGETSFSFHSNQNVDALRMTSREIELSCSCRRFFWTESRRCSRKRAEFRYLLLLLIADGLFVLIVACCLKFRWTRFSLRDRSSSYRRNATCAAIMRCRSTTNRQLAHVQSRHRQYFLWPWKRKSSTRNSRCSSHFETRDDAVISTTRTFRRSERFSSVQGVFHRRGIGVRCCFVRLERRGGNNCFIIGIGFVRHRSILNVQRFDVFWSICISFSGRTIVRRKPSNRFEYITDNNTCFLSPSLPRSFVLLPTIICYIFIRESIRLPHTYRQWKGSFTNWCQDRDQNECWDAKVAWLVATGGGENLRAVLLWCWYGSQKRHRWFFFFVFFFFFSFFFSLGLCLL